MKKILVSLSFILFAAITFAQTVRCSIRRDGNSTTDYIISLRPSANLDVQFSQLLFVIQIPDAVAPKPTLTIESLTPTIFPTAAWNIIEITNSGFHNYGLSILTSNPPNSQLTVGTNYDVIKVKFSSLAENIQVRVAHMAEAGPETKYQYSVTGGVSDFTDYKKMFYSQPGLSVDVPVNPVTGGNEDEAQLNGFNTYQYAETVSPSLPVNFLSFIALKAGDDAKLHWTVENDELNSFFDIERSADGQNFKPFTKVLALQNGQNSNTYETIDERLSDKGSKTLYYRIKQVDKSGYVTYSIIRYLNVDKNSEAISLYPNPARNVTKLVMDVEEATRATITIRDLNGKTLQQIPVQLQKGINQQDINVSRFASGEYNINVYGQGYNPKAIKLIKIN